MKKLIIGILVLGTLVVYSIGIRHQQPKISPPSSLSSSSGGGTSSVASGSSSGTPPNTGTGDNSASTSNSSQASNSGYKDGTYTGSVADAYYGNVQVKATISNGKITDVSFLQYPNTHSTSVYINQQAMPYLQQEAIQAQSANVNIVSGATYTSQAFIQSLGNALSQA